VPFAKIDMPVPFDPNELMPGEFSDPARMAHFPSLPGVLSIDDYADAFTSMGIGGGYAIGGNAAKAEPFMELAKVMGVAGIVDAPEFQTYSKLTSMPNQFTRGLVQWPDLPAATLRKIADEQYIVNTIIQQRVADIIRYSALSSHPWKPGWDIEMRDGRARPSASDLKDIEDARRFTLNCNSVFGWDVRKRDEHHLTPFQQFLAGSVRDTYRYDQIAWWTDMDLKGRVRAFKALPGGNIMRATPEGYEGKKEIFACGVDEVGTVQHQFTRRELTLLVRNARTDGDIYGYGFSEIAQTVRLIQAFGNAFDMNADIFTKDSMPPGLLKLKGMWGQRQVEAMTRIWGNLKRGAGKKWAFPAIPIPRDGDIELLDLSRTANNDMYYSELVNMTAGLFCAIYAFPPSRLGYRISGQSNPTEPKDAQSPATIIDESDGGLPTLLYTIQNGYNEYILRTVWPHLTFRFKGAVPREEGREYEARIRASTLNEVRALSDLPPYEDEFDSEHKELGELMGRAPIDPNLSGIYQSIVSSYLSAKYAPAKESEPGNSMTSKTDPLASEGHGHGSGVRRNSAAETKSAEG
jgi:hypothetical protein